jgi:hypothetical protein
MFNKRNIFLGLTVVLTLALVNNCYSQKAKPKPKAAPKTAKPSSDPFGGATSDPFGGASSGANTQQPPKTTTTTTKSTTNASKDPFAPSSNDPFKSQGNSGQPPANTGGGFSKNLPITVQKSIGGGDPLSDTIKPSLRNPSSIVNQTKDRVPLAWDYVREDDAIFSIRFGKL